MTTRKAFSTTALSALAVFAGMSGLATTAVAQDRDSVPTYTQIRPDDPDFQFMKLGTDRDYLKEERWRIVDQIEQVIPPLYEPHLPLHGYTLPPGAMRFGFSATFGHNPSDFGRDDFYSLFFNEVSVDFVKVNVDFFYGFELAGINDLVLRINIPYKSQRTTGTGHPFRIDPMIMTMEGTAEGLGDISATIKKKWFDQGNAPVTFSTMLGVIAPTGNDEEEFNASQTVMMGGMLMPVTADRPGDPIINVFGRTPMDRQHPRIAQPGNGSWGARFGFGVTKQFDRSALHAGMVFDLLAKNDGITPGNELRYGTSLVFPPLSSDYVTFDLSVFGMWKGNEYFPGQIMHPERDPATGGPVMDASGNMVMFMTDRPSFDHGNVTFISPTIVLLPSPNLRLFLSPAVRVHEPLRGPSPRWTFTAGQTFTF